MDNFKEKLQAFWEKLQDYEFTDFFPLNRQASTLDNLLKVVGIYVGAMIVVGLVILLLGWIPVLGLLLKIAGALVGIYSLVGLIEFLLKYMKYN